RERPFGIELAAADERHREALWVERIIPPVPSFDAQALMVHGAFPPIDADDRLLLNVVCHRTADTAIRTDAVNTLLLFPHNRKRDGLVDERACGTDCCAFAARDTGTVPHRPIEVERNARGISLPGPADHLVGLHLIAGADAAVAENACLVIDGNDGGG